MNFFKSTKPSTKINIAQFPQKEQTKTGNIFTAIYPTNKILITNKSTACLDSTRHVPHKSTRGT